MRVGIAGLGTVGGGLLALLRDNQRLSKAGLEIGVSGVSARNRTRQRAVSIDDYPWFDDPVALATDPATDIFVELIGGADGPAKAAVTAALTAGKPVVTANKALIAEHGRDLAALAESQGVALKYEAAVAGGTPVIRGLRGGAAASDVTAVHGILNGTCNYILSTMAETGEAFETVLLAAQREGFAEADPSFDVDGIDAAHKLAILSMVAFDAEIRMGDITVAGIRDITITDIRMAEQKGLAVKLVGEAISDGHRVGLRVTPAMVPTTSAFAQTRGAENMVAVEATPVGRLVFSGPGAGAGATAAAVAADLVTLARGRGEGAGPVFNAPAEALDRREALPPEAFEAPYFLRVEVADQPGAMASVASSLAEAGLSIDAMTQEPPTGSSAMVAIITHTCSAASATSARQQLATNSSVVGTPTLLPILHP